jgi:hypothetical protein
VAGSTPVWTGRQNPDLCALLPATQLAGYKVKCMLAEPKTKRRADGSPMDIFGHLSGQVDNNNYVRTPGGGRRDLIG